MSWPSWWRHARKLLNACRLFRGHPRRRKPRSEPLIEGLEDRFVPSTTAYQVPGETGGSQAYDGPLGMDFDVDQGIAITRLGAFDSGSDGLARPITVRLFNRATQAEVASVTFAAGDSGSLAGGSRFLTLPTPAFLAPGFQGSIVAEGYGPGEENGNGGSQPITWTTNDGGGLIRFVGGGRFGTTPGACPTTLDSGPANAYAAGTFDFLAYHDLASGPVAATAGVPYVLRLNLPGAANVTGWTIDWGDGTVQGVAGNPAQATHTYAAEGSYAIAVTVDAAAFGSYGTIYRDVVLGANPTAYWRLDESSIVTPAAQDETGGPGGAYFNFEAGAGGQTGALAGDPNTAIRFDGEHAHVLTPDLTARFADETVTFSVWFNANGPGVVVDELGQGALETGWHDSQLEVLPSGEVRARVWGMPSSLSLGTVAFGSWHHAVLRYSKATLTLDGFLDGVAAGSVGGDRQAPSEFGYRQFYALGAGDTGHMGSGAFFDGLVDEFAVFSTAPSNAEVAALYQAGTTAGGSYAAQVLALNPVLHWRLGEAPVAPEARDATGSHDAVYRNFDSFAVGHPGGLVQDAGTSVGFNGLNQYVNLPEAAFGSYPNSGSTTSYALTFAVWFRTSGHGVILGQTGNTTLPGGAEPNGWLPAVYVGIDGRVRSSLFWHGAIDPIVSPTGYSDDRWHFLVASYDHGVETLHIDGIQLGSKAVPVVGYSAGYAYHLGTGYTRFWPATNWGWSFFFGRMDEAAVYQTALTPQQIQAQYLAGITAKQEVTAGAPAFTVPVVSAGADALIAKGSSFTGAGSFTDPATSVPWSAVVNYGDGFGDQPLVLSGNSFALNHLYADDGDYTVTVRVTNVLGETGSDALVVNVENVAPDAGVAGPADGVRGQARTFVPSAEDRSPVDQAAGFSYTIDWGDGSAVQVVAQALGGGASVDHVYALAGSYVVTVTAADKDGATSDPVTHTIEVTAWGIQLQPDPLNPGALIPVLVVGGGTGNDAVRIGPADRGKGLSVRVREGDGQGRWREPLSAPVDRVVIYGGAGNDVIDVADSITVPVEIYGGAGNDQLAGGGGSNLLVGGDGSDTLLGGRGRDLLIGGAGSDWVRGQGGEDILVAGASVFDSNLQALRALQAEWSPPADRATRVRNLSGDPGGRNAPYFLEAATVRDDLEFDVLFGVAGKDWFLAGQGDRAPRESGKGK